MTRPVELFPLFAGLETLEGVGPKLAKLFPALGVEKPKDLLFLLPHSGVDRSRKASVRDVVPPCTVTVMTPEKSFSLALSPLPANSLPDSPPRLKLRSRVSSLATMPGIAEIDPEALPVRLMLADDDWLAGLP